MAVKLHVARYGAGAPVLLLHGLFGAGNNLGALARALRDRFEAVTIDLPDHGRSDWLAHTDLPRMAECLRQWMDEQNLQHVHLVGHSLGGKVAMQLALSHPQRVAALVVADIAPVLYPAQHDAVFSALAAVAAAGCTSRDEAAALMTAEIEEHAVTQFLLTGLQRGADGAYRWRFNLAGIRAAYPALCAAPRSDGAYPGPVLFLKGGDSDYIGRQHRDSILALFPAAEVKVMPGCGHWLHAEQPGLFNSIVARFLQAQLS